MTIYFFKRLLNGTVVICYFCFLSYFLANQFISLHESTVPYIHSRSTYNLKQRCLQKVPSGLKVNFTVKTLETFVLCTHLPNILSNKFFFFLKITGYLISFTHWKNWKIKSNYPFDHPYLLFKIQLFNFKIVDLPWIELMKILLITAKDVYFMWTVESSTKPHKCKEYRVMVYCLACDSLHSTAEWMTGQLYSRAHWFPFTTVVSSILTGCLMHLLLCVTKLKL